MNGQGTDPKELVMQLIQTLGADFVMAVLTDDALLNMMAQFIQAVGQMQPEQRQQLAQIVQQMAQQGAGNAEQTEQEAPQQSAAGYGGQQGGNPFAG